YISGSVGAEFGVATSSGGVATASVAVTSTVETRSMQDLPMRGRSLQSVMELPVGIVSSATWEPSTISPYKLSVTGQRTTSNYFTVDGVSANVWIAPGGQDAGATAAGTLPGLNAIGGTNSLATVEAVQEVTIRTFAIQPAYGRVPGAEIEIVTRSGTNEFHGSLFEYFGNDALDANDWFANSRTLRKPARRLNDFGGAFGGPLKKDSTFFFATYEGLRLRQPVVALTDVPSQALRALAPAALQPFLNAYPLPNGLERDDGFAEFAGSYSNPARLDVGSFRLDRMSGDKLSTMARYNYAASSAEERGLYGSSLNTLNRRRSQLQTVTGRAMYTFSPTVVGEVRANYSRLTYRGAFDLDSFGGANVSTGSGLFNSFFSGRAALASLDLQGRNSMLMTGSEAESVQRQFNVPGAVTAIAGNHILKFGVDYRRIAPTIALRPLEQSVLFNGALQTLTGDATRIGVYTRPTSQRPVFNNFSAYGQDEWSITSRLKLTYGLRWDVNPPPAATDGAAPFAVTQVQDLSQLSIAQQGTRATDSSTTLETSRPVTLSRIRFQHSLAALSLTLPLRMCWQFLPGTQVYPRPFLLQSSTRASSCPTPPNGTLRSSSN
ncbi:MAG: TonB-dependent receptor, partial [Acidobacteria bacterium]|nr:TonB-dependent receptor [Acidobacteriota bacterium]